MDSPLFSLEDELEEFEFDLGLEGFVWVVILVEVVSVGWSIPRMPKARELLLLLLVVLLLLLLVVLSFL